MPSLAAGLAAERRRKNAKHARRLEKKLGVKVAGSEERRLSGVFSHSVSALSRTFSRRRSSDAFDMSRAEKIAQESRRRLRNRIDELAMVAVTKQQDRQPWLWQWQRRVQAGRVGSERLRRLPAQPICAAVASSGGVRQ